MTEDCLIVGFDKWKTLKENPAYEINSQGLVRNISTMRVLSRMNNSKGYPRVRLSKKGKEKKYFVHRLVASNFIPNPSGKKEVNHIDRNPGNSNVLNLEWCSKAENMNHVYGVNKRYGIRKRRGGYMVIIRFGGTQVYLGDYKDKEMAYKVFSESYYIAHGFYPWKTGAK